MKWQLFVWLSDPFGAVPDGNAGRSPSAVAAWRTVRAGPRRREAVSTGHHHVGNINPIENAGAIDITGGIERITYGRTIAGARPTRGIHPSTQQVHSANDVRAISLTVTVNITRDVITELIQQDIQVSGIARNDFHVLSDSLFVAIMAESDLIAPGLDTVQDVRTILFRKPGNSCAGDFHHRSIDGA